MSLATRCTACGTVFRVVQDQLKVSEGWVRCGRCDEVFNALEGLFDLERDVPPPGSPEPSQLLRASGHADDGVGSDADPAASAPSLIEKIDAQLLGPRAREDGSTPATRINERDRLEFPDAQFDPDVLADAAHASGPDLFDEHALRDVGGDAPPASSEAPEFIQRAQRQERWHSAGMRATLAAVAVLLLVALGLQAGHQFRDLIAARWPDARPTLVAWCGLWSCTIEAPRRIEDVSVENSSLTRASVPDAFRLSVALRNRSAMTVALPSVDLNLTDTTGQLVARRVLSPADFRSPSAVMAPGAEASLQVVLATGSARVTGYTVEVFYP